MLASGRPPCPLISRFPTYDGPSVLVPGERSAPASSSDPPAVQQPGRSRSRHRSCIPDSSKAMTARRLSLADVRGVEYRMSPGRRKAGFVLKRCTDVVDSILALHPGLVVFKLGITTSPDFRWSNRRFGYKHDADRYQALVVLCKTDGPEALGFVEAALIMRYRATPGCRNEAVGGEALPSTDSGNAFYAYIVFRVLPKPPKQLVVRSSA